VAGEGAVAGLLAAELGLAAAPPTPEPGTGIVFSGDDAALAAFALGAGPEVAILYAPTGPSDLARMFAFGDRDIGSRLRSGERYPTDLILATADGITTPVIAHAIASRRGGLPRWFQRPGEISLLVGDRPKRLRASGLVIANAQHVGRRTVAPRAALMDGRAEVQVLGGTVRERLRADRAMSRGLHVRMPGVDRRPFSRLVVEVPSRWVFTLDGVPVAGGRWEFVVHPAAITLWV
jgi:hypothetical protein